MKAWDFFMDPKHIEKVSPKEFNEVLIRCSTSRLGLNTELWVSTGLFVTKNWHSKITHFREFNEFTDEVQQSKLLKWSHMHQFVKVGDKTHLIDEINFKFGYGLVGQIIENIVFPRMKMVFSNRERKIKEILEN
jgi:ligand-binding SRPBCC domain-containing protein